MENGEEVDELNLPIDVSPDYICGCSKQDRLNKYSNIIKEYSNKKNELSQKIEKAKQTIQSTNNKREIEKNVIFPI
jgi:hypothetical protein